MNGRDYSAASRPVNETTAWAIFVRRRFSGSSIQAVADLVETASSAGVIQLGAGGACGPDGADRFVAQLDDDTTAEEHDMRQFRQRGDRILAFGPLGEGERVVLEGNGGIGLVVRAIQCMHPGAVPAKRRDRHAVGVE